jgi:hypothetical protein
MSDPLQEYTNLSVKARRALFESKKNGKSTKEGTNDPRHGTALNGDQNKQLTCLSSNSAIVRHDIHEKDVIYLKKEISHLQKRISKLDANNNQELIGIINAKNQESEQEEKEVHLKQLNEKLLQIQTGLREIESERQQLIEKAKALEQEKRTLEDQLRLRDKEIQSLTERCSSTADNGKVSTKLPSLWRTFKVRHDLTYWYQSQQKIDSHVDKFEAELKISQAARSELETKLASLARDYENVCENLVQCFGNVKRIELEKVAWEDENRRLQQKVQLELEQQSLCHTKTTLKLKQEVQSRGKKVEELEKILQDKIRSILFLRESMRTLESSHKIAMKNLANKYEVKISEMTKSHDFQAQETQSHLQVKCAENEKLRADFSLISKENEALRNDIIMKSRTIDNLREEITVKTSEIDSLRKEIFLKTNENEVFSTEIEVLRKELSSQMQELMTVTAEHQKRQEECKMVDALVQDVEALEQDRYNLQETLHEKNIAIAELEAEILKLEIEKELALHASENVQSLRKQLDEAGECKSNVRRLERKLMEMEKERDRLETKLHEQASRLHSTESEIANLQADHVRLKDQVRETQNTLDSSTLVLEQRELELKETKTTLQAKQHTFDSEVTLLQEKAEDYRAMTNNELEISRSKIHDLETMVYGLTSSKSLLEDQSRDKQTIISKISEATDMMRQKWEISQVTIIAMERKMKENQSERSKLELQVKIFKDELEILQEKHQRLLQTSKESEQNVQGALDASEQKIIAQEEQICLLERKLFENAQGHSSVKKVNQELAANVEALKTEQSMAEEKLSLLTVQLQDKEQEMKRQHLDWQKKEDAYLEKLHKESQRRELCEVDLCEARTKLEKIRIEYKDCVELEKENIALKDKIRRQEAYLRRKLEQEKVIRERLPGSAVKVNQVKTAGRSSLNAPLTQGKGLSTSKATLSTVSDSLDWELDELLAD